MSPNWAKASINVAAPTIVGCGCQMSVRMGCESADIHAQGTAASQGIERWLYSVAWVVFRYGASDDGKRTPAKVDGVVRICQVVSSGKGGGNCRLRIL
jgi:hypothetical protein